MVSLCHQPTEKKLIVRVISARNLIKSKLVGKVDPYVKMKLWHKEKKIDSTKTDTQKNTHDPFFNKTKSFDLPDLDSEGLKNIKLVFKVMDEDIGKDEVMGRLVIGGKICVGTGLNHWNKVMATPSVETEVWHPLSESGVTNNEFEIEENDPEPLEKNDTTSSSATDDQLLGDVNTCTIVEKQPSTMEIGNKGLIEVINTTLKVKILTEKTYQMTTKLK